jgi:hypothetical protein
LLAVSARVGSHANVVRPSMESKSMNVMTIDMMEHLLTAVESRTESLMVVKKMVNMAGRLLAGEQY